MLRSLNRALRTSSVRNVTFKNVQLSENHEGYEVLIDGRKLRVPRTSNVLKIKSRDLAEIVALEWAGQEGRNLAKIKKHSLYMTQLCYAESELRETTDKAELIDDLLKYLQTDTCLFRSPFTEADSLDGTPSITLVEAQDEKWTPVQNWFEERFGTKLEVAKGFRLPTVPEDAYKNLRSHLNSYDVGVLIALDKMCLALKSMMLCLMVIERKLSVEDGVLLSRLENEYQKDNWGTVEYHHTVEECDIRAKVASQALFIRYSVEDIDSDPKLISDYTL